MVDQLKRVGEKSILRSKQLIEISNGGTPALIDEERDEEEQFLVVIFIIRSDYNRFRDLIKDILRNDIQWTDK